MKTNTLHFFFLLNDQGLEYKNELLFEFEFLGILQVLREGRECFQKANKYA